MLSVIQQTTLRCRFWTQVEFSSARSAHKHKVIQGGSLNPPPYKAVVSLDSKEIFKTHKATRIEHYYTIFLFISAEGSEMFTKIILRFALIELSVDFLISGFAVSNSILALILWGRHFIFALWWGVLKLWFAPKLIWEGGLNWYPLSQFTITLPAFLPHVLWWVEYCQYQCLTSYLDFSLQGKNINLLTNLHKSLLNTGFDFDVWIWAASSFSSATSMACLDIEGQGLISFSLLPALIRVPSFTWLFHWICLFSSYSYPCLLVLYFAAEAPAAMLWSHFDILLVVEVNSLSPHTQLGFS